MRYENKFDEAIDEVAAVHGLNWDPPSKIIIFARFLKHYGVEFQAWEKFLELEADDELTDNEVKDIESGEKELEDDQDYDGAWED